MAAQVRVRVALVGGGRIARVHLGYLNGLPAAELVAVCDVDARVRTELSARAAVPAYESLTEMLRCAAPQVVHVTTPPQTHVPLALECIEAGVHVLVEKPMAPSRREAEELREAATRRGVFVSADHNRCFDPVSRRARDLIVAGELGELLAVDVFQGAGGAVEPVETWKSGLPGGPIHDLLPHPYSLLRSFVGPVRNSVALARRDASGALDEVRTVARGEACLGTVTVSRRALPASNWVRLVGSRAMAEINLNHMTLLRHRTHRVPKLVGKVIPNADLAWQLVRETTRNVLDFALGRQRFYPGIGLHLRELYDNLARGLPPPVSAEEACDVVALCEQALTAESEEPQ